MVFVGTDPVSGKISNSGDLYVELDLEVGDGLYLEKFLFMNRDSSPNDADQFIYFADSSNQDDEQFGWDDSADAFEFSNDLRLRNPDSSEVRVMAEVEGELQLLSEVPRMAFLVDADSDDSAAVIDHTFTWSNNSLSAGARAMVLRSVTGDVGNLELNGTLSENVSFDLAESFWISEPAAAGQLVAVDPERPDAVVLAGEHNASMVLGVVSTRPGILMGGGAFSVEALRASWGEEVASVFESERPELESGVLLANETLRREAEALGSISAYAAERVASATRALAEDREPMPDRSFDPSTDSLAAAYSAALEGYGTRLFDASMRLFFERHFVSLALAGRVPVEVDASYTPVRPGDPLTVSETPGVARVALQPGPIVGTALEALDGGRGQVLMLVHRGWYGGASATAATGLRAELEQRDRTIASLRSELSRLSLEVGRLLASRPSAQTVSATR